MDDLRDVRKLDNDLGIFGRYDWVTLVMERK